MMQPEVCASGEGTPCHCQNGIVYYGERYQRSDTGGQLNIDFSHELSYEEMIEYPHHVKDMSDGGIMTMCTFMQFASDDTQFSSYYQVKSDKQCFCFKPKNGGAQHWDY